jgi:hypothetical protein
MIDDAKSSDPKVDPQIPVEAAPMAAPVTPPPAAAAPIAPAPTVAPATPPPAPRKSRRGCVTCLVVTLVLIILLMCMCSCAGFGALSLAGAKGQPGTIIPPTEESADKPAGTTLSIPTGLAAAAADAAINLKWHNVAGSGANGVKVYRSEKPAGGYAELAALKTSDTAYSDTDVKKGVTYYYVITATAATGAESGNSNSVFAALETPALVPDGIYSWEAVKAKAESDDEYLRILTKVTGLTMDDVTRLVGKEKTGMDLKTTVLKGTVITNTMEDYRIVANFVLPNDRECLTDENGTAHVMTKCGNPIKVQAQVTPTAVVVQQTQVVINTVINIFPTNITNIFINAGQTANGVIIAVLPEGILINMGPGFNPYPPDVYVDPVDFGDDIYDPEADVELEEGQQWIEEGRLLVSANPPDPGPQQDVVMTIGLIPAKAGIDITYSMTGSDGYSKSDTVPTDENGQISFTIPGGAEGVTDSISVSVPSEGLEGSVQYVF